MKMTRYSEPQILPILRQAEGGVPGSELCCEHGMSNASFIFSEFFSIYHLSAMIFVFGGIGLFEYQNLKKL